MLFQKPINFLDTGKFEPVEETIRCEKVCCETFCMLHSTKIKEYSI